jgi:hypothetical protein
MFYHIISGKGVIVLSILSRILKVSGKNLYYQRFHLLGTDTDPAK